MADDVNKVALMSAVERYERIEEERKALADDQKEILEAAKEQHALEPKYIKKIVAIRKRDPEEFRIEQANFQVYLEAVGIQ